MAVSPRVPERKVVTILFADFVSFTAFLRDHDPEMVHEWLKSFWAEVDAIIGAHGGKVAKHIGDAVMAVFGQEQAREDAPAQAVRAGLAIQTLLRGLQTAGSPLGLQMRIGVQQGAVVLEPLSDGEFRATGEAINMASRIQQLAPAGSVMITHEVFRSVYGLFDLEPVKPLAVKGVQEKIKAYLVGRVKPRALARQLRDIEGVSTEMVGRKEELRVLQAAFQRVLQQRRGEMVTVLGEAGMGKSRLLQEFQRWAELLPQRFWFFLGQATADMPSMPFSLIRDAFASRFEIRDNDPPAAARQKLEDEIVSLLSKSGATATWPGQEPKQIAHFLGHLLGLDFSASPYIRDLLRQPEQLRSRALHGLRRFFRALGNSSDPFNTSGVLLVAEDIHWSDQGSMDVLEDLAGDSEGIPFFILCFARPTLVERRPEWGQRVPAHTLVKLESLSLQESRTMVSTILRKASGVPTVLRDMITDLAEGNPYYIEEIIKMLIDQKVINPRPDSWDIEVNRLSASRVPQTLAGVLQARLNGLTAEERGVLQRAGVVGRVFWDRAVESLNPSDSPFEMLTKESIAQALESLQRKELVVRRQASAFTDAGEFVFKHELLRNVAYETLLSKPRRKLHAQVAAWLIQQSGVRSAECAPQVAVHFEQAERPVEAAEWYGRAGKQARAGHEPAMAIEYFEKALALLPSDCADHEGDRVEWLCCLMESLCDQARFKEAREVVPKILRRAAPLKDWVSLARGWNGLAFLHERTAANHASVAAARNAETLARKAGAAGNHERLRAMHFRGWALYRLADWQEVLKLSRRTQSLCAKWGDRHGLAACYKLQGVVYLQRGDSERADQCFEEGLRLCKEFGDRRNAAAMLSNLGESARLRGDFAAAVDLYEKALAITRQIGNRESEIVYISNLSGARLGLQQYAEAEAALRHIIPVATTRTSSMLSEAFSFLAEACLGQGKVGEALVAARRAVDLGLESGNELDTAIGWRALGEAAAAQQLQTGAQDSQPKKSDISPALCFSKSLMFCRKIDAEAEEARTLRAWGLYERRCGRENSARDKLVQSRKTFEGLGMSREVQATAAVPADTRNGLAPAPETEGSERRP